MPIMYVPAMLRELLQKATGPVELCDINGNLLGSFLPATVHEKRSPLEPPVTEAELAEAEKEETGFTTEEVLASLEGFPCSR